LIASARESFVSGMHVATSVGAVLLVVMAAVAAFAPRR
jgi:DHA2 family multidrug resistance protein-like MFS transporter